MGTSHCPTETAAQSKRGDKVREIQEALKAKGIDPGPIDGIFGPKTDAAVYGFQLAKGLVADGEVGPETAEALEIEL